ncbi:hypothetical protein ATN89_17295 [Comamonas thiooxydans]|uniref:type II TA system antitoxin MqsA family protein n=1 Tax=Comamonas thiooxydans TaxID=363952 RepID=UPI0007C5CD10|nr:type II TA system antitoxin MqsA family protein [Comamonas thiooxydans]OAD82839.1 hypothetical protein ATN89_17295 [Comamonas thiooxydans]
MTNHCEVCGSADTVHGKMALTRTYKGDTISVDVTATSCNACGEVVMDKENSAIYSEALRLQRERVNAALDDGVVPDLLKSTRAKLGMNQAEAAKFFGGGPNAFSRYERSQATPPTALVHLFTILNKFPELTAMLNPENPGVPPKEVDVEIGEWLQELRAHQRAQRAQLGVILEDEAHAVVGSIAPGKLGHVEYHMDSKAAPDAYGIVMSLTVPNGMETFIIGDPKEAKVAMTATPHVPLYEYHPLVGEWQGTPHVFVIPPNSNTTVRRLRERHQADQDQAPSTSKQAPKSLKLS